MFFQPSSSYDSISSTTTATFRPFPIYPTISSSGLSPTSSASLLLPFDWRSFGLLLEDAIQRGHTDRPLDLSMPKIPKTLSPETVEAVISLPFRLAQLASFSSSSSSHHLSQQATRNLIPKPQEQAEVVSSTSCSLSPTKSKSPRGQNKPSTRQSPDVCIRQPIIKPPHCFKCQMCAKELPTRVGLRRHMYHHRKPFINPNDLPFRCKVCSAAFCYQASLDYHNVSHSLDGSERLSNGFYRCDTCSATFKWLKALKRHKMREMCGDKEQEDPQDDSSITVDE